MTKRKTFVKWAGGKENEWPTIEQNLPSNFERYVEPFVGGGAVYLNIDCKKSLINDKSSELILLYKLIKKGDKEFFKSLRQINDNWILLENIVMNNKDELFDLYKLYKKDNLTLEKSIEDFIEKHDKELGKLLRNEVDINLYNLIIEFKKNMISKFTRMNKLEMQRGLLSDEDVLNNIETAFKSAYYMYFRYLYNNKKKLKLDNSFYGAIFFFVRDYCYASMFRYNANGEFNVPYGGISYNRKDFAKKIEYIESDELRNYLKNTKIVNKDFEDFCKSEELTEKDFMFLDPPYDTEFSTYDRNTFGREDQIRLANYLSETKAKFMLIIKNTDFIYDLYKDRGFYIKSFDKKYLVSFMNRNDKQVKHLLITNYDIGE